ncbi:MAG: histidine--tRNA ligase [Microbacteriaceae bacterium]|jgi:histidyl-tRNA synthetase|nr:histidine--tRNA ligase [Microbacteriaceae bacterium]
MAVVHLTSDERGWGVRMGDNGGMASQVNPPRGMRDFLPSEKAHRERVLAVIRSTYRSHGFDEIETPVMEESDRLHAGLGGDNEKLAFAVMKRALGPDDLAAAQTPLDLADLGLRFDLTVPLSRFYATHRAELPAVFRSIQMASVWRAERPQKGRYRQFVQTDIDIIGEPGPLAEIELITATAATLSALGLTGWTIRVNDRRLLIGMLDALGFEEKDRESALITIDKLDKIGAAGVADELRAKGLPGDAYEQFVNRPQTMEFLPFGERLIRKSLPQGADDEVVAQLARIGLAVDEGQGAPVVQFDPFLVRGMGYYTGAIFEISHPESAGSLGGGGRYDGMIGRFLGSDVPAAGFSIGFERIVDLVEAGDTADAGSVALIYDDDVEYGTLLSLQAGLIAEGKRVRLERSPRNLKALLSQLKESGFSSVANITGDIHSTGQLVFRTLG